MNFKRSLMAFVAAVCPITHAATLFQGNVDYVGTYGDRSMFIDFTGMSAINEPGCAAVARIDVVGTHPKLKEFLSIALAAKASGSDLGGSVNGCAWSGGNPTLDQTSNSYLTLK